jgi:palmitoyltransferase
MLDLALGMAVACLGGFHLYLTLTGQTTIESHGNLMNRTKAKQLGQKWRNPYDLGWKRNLQQV